MTRPHHRPLGIALALAIALATRPPRARAERRILAEAELRVLGVSLRIEPVSQVVPLGVPTIVKTRMVAAGQPDLPVPLGDLPPTMRVRADLSGPSFGPIALECAPGGDLSIPALATEGLYHMQNARLVDDDGLVMMADPADATIRAQQILVSKVEARQLSLDEIRDRGIVIDQDSFQVLNFTISLALESGTVEVSAPMIRLADQPLALPEPRLSRPIDIGPTAEYPPRKEGAPLVTAYGFIPKFDKPDVEARSLDLAGALVFPQQIGFLHQFHSVLLMMTNAAPGGSSLAVKDLQATFKLPSDKLRRARTVPLTAASAPVPVRQPGADGKLGTSDDLDLIVAEASGSSEIVTEGLAEGLHRVDVDLQGMVTGLPGGDAPIHGSVAGVVLVRNPKFSLTFLLPSAVQEGREFFLSTVLTNTSDVPANLASLRMSKSAVSGAVLLSDEMQVLDTIPPGESAVARFRLRALRTGRVVATRFSNPSKNLTGRFDLQLAVGDDQIPISPEVVNFPDAAYNLNAALPSRPAGLSLVEGLLTFAGTAWADATAPAGTLPPGIPQLDTRVVLRFGAQVADAGQRVDLGEPVTSVLGHLLLRLTGAEDGDPALDTLRRRSSRWREVTEALADGFAGALRGGAAGELAESIARSHFYLEPFMLAGLDSGTDGAVRLRIEDAFRRRLGGAEAARDLPDGDLLHLDGRRELGVIGRAPGAYKVVLEAVESGIADLTVLVPHRTGAGKYAPRRVRFPAVPLEAGDEAEVLLDPTSSSYALNVGSAVFPGEVIEIDAPALALVSAKVATSFDAGQHVVALFFNRPVDASSAERAGSYAFEGDPMRAQAVRSATTQISGRFVFLQLVNPVPPQPWSRIRVSGVRDREGNAGTSAVQDIEVPPAEGWGTVTGTVVDARGRPVPGQSVLLSETVPATYGGTYVLLGTAIAPCDGGGNFKFWFARRSGRVLQARSIDPRTGEAAEAYGTIRGDREELRLKLRFLGRGDVTGRVIDGSGQPVEHALVTGTGTTRDDFAQRFTAGDGRFHLDNLPVGAINLSAKTVTGQFGAATAVLPEAGAVVDAGDLMIDTVDTGSVHGRVTENGIAVPAAPVLIRALRTSPAWGTWTRTDADGIYRFKAVPAGAGVETWVLDPSDYATERARARDRLEPGGDLTLDLAFARGKGRVTGIVLDGWGKPRAGVAVQMVGHTAVASDADGKFNFADVPLGGGSVRAADGPREVGASFQLSFDGQEAAVVLRFPAVGSVSVTVARAGAPLAGASVTLRDVGLGCSELTNSQGKCDIIGVPVGVYVVDVFKQPIDPSEPKQAGIGKAIVRFDGDSAGAAIDVPVGVRLQGATYSGPAGNVLGGARVELFALGLDDRNHIDRFWLPPVTSDPTTGQFEFPHVLVGPYHLRASSSLIATEAHADGVLAAAGTVDLVFPDTTPINVTLHVTLPDGSEPSSPASLTSRLWPILSEGAPEDGSGQDHVFSVDGGRFGLEASYPGEDGRLYRGVGGGYFYDDQTYSLRLPGFGTVTGRVRDANGNLVTGDPPVVVTLRAAALPHEPAERSLTTRDGSFRFEDVREGFVSIFASRLADSGNLWGDVGSGATLDREVFFAPAGVVTGAILREDGTSLARDVSVYLKKWDRTGWVTVDAAATDDRGAFSLGPVGYEPGGTPYRLLAFDLFTGRYAGESFVLDAASRSFTLRLGGRGTAEGFVFESNGVEPIPETFVSLQAGSSAPEIRALSLLTRVDASGFYRFLGVSEGSFDACASKPYTELLARGTGVVLGESNVARLDLLLEPHGNVAGRVTRDGVAVKDASVRLYMAGAPYGTFVERQSDSRDDHAGEFLFEDVRLGEFDLTAQATGTYNDRGRLTGRILGDGDVYAANLALSGFATVRVRVDDGQSGTQYHFVLQGGDGDESSANGHEATFANVTRGALSVYAEGLDNPANRGTYTGVIPPEAGDFPVVVQIGPVSTLRGTVHDGDGVTPARDAVVELGIGSERYLRQTGAGGEFDFGHVKASAEILLDVRSADGKGTARRRDAWTTTDEKAYDDLTLDRTAPRLVSSSPAADATGVSGIDRVRLTFTEPMDERVAQAGGAQLVLEGESVAGVTVTAAGSDLELNLPAGGLVPARTYTALIRAAAEDRNGQPVGRDLAVRFTTQDTEPPTASLQSPAAGAANVPLETPVKVLFTEPVDAGTLASGVTLSCGGVDQGAAAADPSGLRAVFSGLLPSDSLCIATVSEAVRDRAGNPAVAASWTFTTEDTTPPVLSGLVLDPSSGPYPEGSLILLRAETPSGDVTRIDFAVQGVPSASAGGSPWEASIEVPTQAGAGGSRVEVAAVAMDDAGNRSDPLRLTLDISADQPPRVWFERPKEGSPFDARKPVSLQVKASDDAGLAEIAWRAEGSVSAQGTQAPAGMPREFSLDASFIAEAAEEGPVTLTATATDRFGNTAVARPVHVTLTNTGVSGIVYLREGQDVAPDVTVTLTGASQTFSGRTGGDGRYRVGATPGTSYGVRFADDGGHRAAASSPTLTAGEVTELGPVTLSGAGRIAGAVTLLGSPHGGSRVNLRSPIGDVEATADGQGRFDADKVPGSVLRISGVSPETGFESDPIEVNAAGADGFTREVTVPLRVPRLISFDPPVAAAGVPVTVRIYGDWIHAQAVVSVDGTPVASTWRSQTWIDATLPAHAAGTVAVQLLNPDGGWVARPFVFNPGDLGKLYREPAYDVRVQGGDVYAATGPGVRAFRRDASGFIDLGVAGADRQYSRLALAGDWAFAASDDRVYLFAIVDRDRAPQPAGSSASLGDLVTDLVAVGPGEAWALAGNRAVRLRADGAGLHVVDPPVYLGLRVARARMSGGRLYVASPGDQTPSIEGGIRVFDVADPERPALLGELRGSYTALAVAGTRAVAARTTGGGAVLDVLDVSNPQAITTVATFSWPRSVGDLVLSGGRAYACDGGHLVASITLDPPGVDATTVDLGYGALRRLLFDGPLLYAAADAGGLRAFDLGTARPPLSLHLDCEAAPVTGGTTLWISGFDIAPGTGVTIGETAAGSPFVGEDGLRVIAPAGSGTADVVVTNPQGSSVTLGSALEYTAEPRLFGVAPATDASLGGARLRLDGVNLTDGTEVHVGSHTLAANGGTVTAPGGASGDVQAVSVADRPPIVQALATRWVKLDLEREGPLTGSMTRYPSTVSGNADGSVDVATESELFRLQPDGRVSRYGRYEGNPYRQLSGHLLFYPHEPGVKILDVSDPVRPVPAGEIADPAIGSNPMNIVLTGTRLYTAAGGCVFDVADPSTPARLGCAGVDLASGLGFGFAASGAFTYDVAEAGPGTWNFRVIDYRSPANPRVTLIATPTLKPSSVAVAGKRAFVMTLLGSLYGVDLSDPARPVLHGPYTPPAGVKFAGTAPVFAGDDIYVQITGGLLGLHVDSNWVATESDRIPDAALGSPFEAVGGRIFTRGSQGRLRVYETAARALAPAIASIDPSSGTGGTVVSLYGSRFAEGAVVRFAGTVAPTVSVLDPGHILVTAPAGGATGEVVVEEPGDLVSSSGPTFVYQDPPEAAIVDVRPTWGPLAGGWKVTLRGAALQGTTAVVFRQDAGGQSYETTVAPVLVLPDRVVVTAPEAPGLVRGPATLVVSDGTRQITKEDVLRYVPDEINLGFGSGAITVCDGILYHVVGRTTIRSFDLAAAGAPLATWSGDAPWLACSGRDLLAGHSRYAPDGTVSAGLDLSATGAVVSDGRLYAVSPWALYVYDADTLSPLTDAPLSGFYCYPSASLFAVRDRLAVVCSGGTSLLDISDLPPKLLISTADALQALDGPTAVIGRKLNDLRTNLAAPIPLVSSPLRFGQVALTPNHLLAGGNGIVEVWQRDGSDSLTLQDYLFPSVPFSRLLEHDGLVVLDNGPTILRLTRQAGALRVSSTWPDRGPATGGQQVIAAGDGLDGLDGVDVEGTELEAAAIRVLSPHQVLLTLPAHPEGAATITFRPIDGDPVVATFTYEAGEHARYLCPASGAKGATFGIGLEVAAASATTTMSDKQATTVVPQPHRLQVTVPDIARGKVTPVVHADDGREVSLPGPYEVK